MVDLHKALSNIRPPKRSNTVQLRGLPLIAEIEAMIGKGAGWAKEFDEKCSAASLALFGITETDARPPEPHPDDFSGRERYFFSEDAFESYDAAIGAWFEFEGHMRAYEEEAGEVGMVAYWRGRGYDVTDGEGKELRCFPQFARQLYVAVTGLLPGAKVTLDGSGQRGEQSLEQWEAALVAAASNYRPARG